MEWKTPPKYLHFIKEQEKALYLIKHYKLCVLGTHNSKAVQMKS